MSKTRPKFIFTVGGVLSGLGKGIVTSSVGFLLKSYGYKVTAIKIDPYISIDAGTMRPAEHGEVFITEDGGEIDQDLGNYERFMEITLSKKHNLTTGKVFQRVIDNERAFVYGGRDVEMFPDVVNEIKKMIFEAIDDEDFVLIEVGGTTGDLENLPFLHAARQLGREYPSVYLMITYLPYLKNIGELKTKPTQHAVARLREVGIFPDFIVTRNEIPIDKPRIETISKRCFVDEEDIIDDPDTDNIYEIPFLFIKGKFGQRILAKFGMKAKTRDFKKWRVFVNNLSSATKKVRIGIVGKYVMHGSAKHGDVYISVIEAIKHACAYFKLLPDIKQINSQSFENMSDEQIKDQLSSLDGIIVPQGWGSRGVEGKIAAVKYARENKIPYLGLCFGMQMAVIEFARNVCHMQGANSTEVDAKTNYPVIHIMPDQAKYLAKNQYGGTIRLGAWPCVLRPGSLIESLYKQYAPDRIKPEPGKTGRLLIYERHRHRYEMNDKYKKRLQESGLYVSGFSPDGKLAEAVELAPQQHPFFVGSQFHPEYKSRPLHPHPLFIGFIRACNKRSREV